MDINVRVLSFHDKDNNTTALLYEAFFEENGVVFDQRPIKYLNEIKEVSSNQESNDFIKQNFSKFLNDIKTTFNYKKIKIISKDNSIEKTIFNEINKEPNISFPRNRNRYSFTEDIRKLRSDIIKKYNTQKENTNYSNDLTISELKTLKSKSTEKEKYFNEKYKKNVIENTKNKLFFNVAFYFHQERKRFCYGLEVFKSKHDMMNNKNILYRQEKLSKGDLRIGGEFIREDVEDKILKFINQNPDKKVHLNISTKSRYVVAGLYNMIREANLEHKVDISNKWTYFLKELATQSEKLIQQDIKQTLEKIKDPKTISIWTDGATNRKERYSGSGILIKHDNNIEEFALTNNHRNEKLKKNVRMQDYAEFKAVYYALRYVAENKKSKNKEIMLIIDNDKVSEFLSKSLNNEYYEENPFADEINDIIKQYKLKINYHGLKSHIREDIKKEEKEQYYDFYYNNKVDELAKIGAKSLIRNKTLKM